MVNPANEHQEFKKILDEYAITMGDVSLPVKIVDVDDYVFHYIASVPAIDVAIRIIMEEVRSSLSREVKVETAEILDPKKADEIKNRFLAKAKEKLRKEIKSPTEETVNILARVLVNEMVGLGELECLISDERLEEIVVNSGNDPVWAYHKKYQWVKTNIIMGDEEKTKNYSSRIARQIGKEITIARPLLDASLITGDRVNATLMPVSSAGNTITIRKFSRTPWTMVHMIDPKWKTISSEATAFLWLAMEYELSIIVAGGTGSGKTSILNALMPFFPANQRIITMEDTRELCLPGYLHWVPMTTLAANPRGEGEVSMQDLVVNSLRMRPDRIVVGEVRAKREAEVLFEAMHTGHSVYATFHAERAIEVVDRITNPPMSIPLGVLSSLHLILVQYRNRKTGIRRAFEITELVKTEVGKPKLNTVYQWDPKEDFLKKVNPSIRVQGDIETFSGMNEREMNENIGEKKKILEWLLANNVKDIDDVGRIVAEYYKNKKTILSLIE